MPNNHSYTAQQNSFWDILDHLPSTRKSNAWDNFNPRMQKIPTSAEIRKLRRKKRDIIRSLGDEKQDHKSRAVAASLGYPYFNTEGLSFADSDSEDEVAERADDLVTDADQDNVRIRNSKSHQDIAIASPSPLLSVDTSRKGMKASVPINDHSTLNQSEKLARPRLDRTPMQKLVTNIMNKSMPSLKMAKSHSILPGRRKNGHFRVDDNGIFTSADVIFGGFDSDTRTPLTPMAMTHFAPPLADQQPVIRRSFLTPDQSKVIYAQHYSQFPVASFQLPYLASARNEGGGVIANTDGTFNVASKRDDDISPLHRAAGTGNVELLVNSLTVFDINSTDREGRTPLIYAVIGNDSKIISILHKHKANLDCTDFDGRSAVHWAAYYGRHLILKQLIKFGANWRMHDNEGRSALHWSTGNENTHALEVLLDKATMFEINEPDSEQMTLAHWAIFHNHPKHLKKILKLGANIMLTDVEGKTPLHWCSSHKDVSCAKLLLKHESRVAAIADLDGRTPLHLACAENNVPFVTLLASTPDCDVNARDMTLRTALHWATVSGHHLLANLLLENGASDGVKDRSGASPLHYACSKNHAQCVAALFSQSSPSYLADDDGRHALMWAVTKGHVQSVRILLEKKVDCNYVDNRKSGALHAAAHAGQTHCVSLLLENGAQVDALDELNHTPLFRAVEKGYAEAANMLIQAQANVNQVDDEKRSPLHWAALFGHLPVLSLLLSNDSQVDQVDKYGKTPAHCGAYNGHNEVVKYLIECGADVDKTDNEWLTPLHWAAVMGNPHTVELLLMEGANKNPSDKNWAIPTPLDYAIAEGQEACANFLIQFGAKGLISIKEDAAIAIQRLWRGYQSRKVFSSSFKLAVHQQKLAREKASIKIQRFVRRIHTAIGTPAFLSSARTTESTSHALTESKSSVSTPQTQMTSRTSTKEQEEIQARYQKQLTVIEQHQRELEELKRLTELKLQQLNEALGQLQTTMTTSPVHETLPPSVTEVQMPYGIVTPVIASEDSKRERSESESTEQAETGDYVASMDRKELGQLFALTMTTAEQDYFKIEKGLRQKEAEKRK